MLLIRHLPKDSVNPDSPPFRCALSRTAKVLRPFSFLTSRLQCGALHRARAGEHRAYCRATTSPRGIISSKNGQAPILQTKRSPDFLGDNHRVLLQESSASKQSLTKCNSAGTVVAHLSCSFRRQDAERFLRMCLARAS
jgi:hypothetical protein